MEIRNLFLLKCFLRVRSRTRVPVCVRAIILKKFLFFSSNTQSHTHGEEIHGTMREDSVINVESNCATCDRAPASTATSQVRLHYWLLCVRLSVCQCVEKFHFNFLIPFRWHVNANVLFWWLSKDIGVHTTRNKMIFRLDRIVCLFYYYFCFLCLFNSFVGASSVVQQVEFITLRRRPKRKRKNCRAYTCVFGITIYKCAYHLFLFFYSSSSSSFTFSALRGYMSLRTTN